MADLRKRSLLVIAVALAAACDVNGGYFEGEFNAGGADPNNFPPPFRGDGCYGGTCIRERAASGAFAERGAYVRGKQVGYFFFPFSPSQVATTNYVAPAATPSPAQAGPKWPDGVVDPLRVAGPGTDFRQNSSNPVPVPRVYNFDPPGGTNPLAEESKCTPPKNYAFDPVLEGVPLDKQWNVFTFLPDRFTFFRFGELPTWTYRPIVAEVTVTTNAINCQEIKSERTLLARADDGKIDVPRGDFEADRTRLGLPDPNKFLAWAIIDPGSAVTRVGETANVIQGGLVSGTSVQKYGWYGQFIVAYIDGGYIPVEDGPLIGGLPTKRARPQRLYYPRSMVQKPAPSPSAARPRAAAGRFGDGYDVLQGNRFDDIEHYSPVCELWTYSLPGTTDVAALPQDEATILEKAASTLEPARTEQSGTAFTPSREVIPQYIFCLQAAPFGATPAVPPRP